uniref:H15 domain-containing protein n=1 Tax=Meloidogyne hapla TaxID=6305 RepID=A0A1I8BXC6_MELHA
MWVRAKTRNSKTPSSKTPSSKTPSGQNTERPKHRPTKAPSNQNTVWTKHRLTKIPRYYPIVGVNGEKTLLSILKAIMKFEISSEKSETNSTEEIRWHSINKLFLPLPQWRRAQTALLYCEKELGIEKVRSPIIS